MTIFLDACALAVPEGGCLFLTNDKRFDRVAGLSLVVLGDIAGAGSA